MCCLLQGICDRVPSGGCRRAVAGGGGLGAANPWDTFAGRLRTLRSPHGASTALHALRDGLCALELMPAAELYPLVSDVREALGRLVAALGQRAVS